jgi:hypothetical protein
LITIGPLLLLYEILVLLQSRGNQVIIRNYGDYWLKQIVENFGIHGPFMFGAVLFGVFVITFFLREKNVAPLRLFYFIIMFLESLLYATLMVLVMAHFSLFFANPGSYTPVIQFTLAVGAGVYEELLFRALLFFISAITLIKVLKWRPAFAFAITAVLSSLAFSWFHYWDNEKFTMVTFIYRFLAGLFFCFLYKVRGLGVTSLTHTFYDMLIIIV